MTTIETWPGTGPPVHGSPTGGPARYWFADELVLDADGVFWKCTAPGRPGTWEQISADSGASSPLFIAGPFTVNYNDAGLATTGVDLFTTEAGDMLFGVSVELVIPFDSGERLGIGTPNMLADSDYVGASSSTALAVDASGVQYTAPGGEGSYYPATAMEGPNRWVIPVATVVRAKAINGGNAAGQVKIRVLGYHDMD